METTKLNEELLDQYIAAGSSDTKQEQLRVLAEHFCDRVRLRVAENPNTSPEILWNLAHDNNPDIRVAVGCNRSSTSSLLELLLRDSDVVVRHGLAQNIDTPKQTLEILAHDENGWVRGEALKSLSILEKRSVDEVGKRRRQNRARKSLGENQSVSQGLAS